MQRYHIATDRYIATQQSRIWFFGMTPRAGGAARKLLALVKASGLHDAPLVLERLEREHGVTTKDELVEVLRDRKRASEIPASWLQSLRTQLGEPEAPDTGVMAAPLNTISRHVSIEEIGGTVLSKWKPNGDEVGPELVVMQGDLTACKTDAIVNAANSRLMHGGGLAGAIVRRGGAEIQTESSAWIKRHGKLPVGAAMSTAAGKLPCKYVVHTVGPNVSRFPSPMPEHTEELRKAVWNALLEAERLELTSIAIPGISTGIFGYPRDQGAQEIVQECVRFSDERSSTCLRLIALMNIDDPTVSSFVRALQDVKDRGETTTARSTEQSAQPEEEITAPIINQLSSIKIRE
ncbi:hypothetical protein BBJ28_00012871 [Nothophytophthora sp. Chile5]|nr:hypothetical protein BBJ28_00012871 [Nothophytophthora sp. Chile5]